MDTRNTLPIFLSCISTLDDQGRLALMAGSGRRPVCCNVIASQTAAEMDVAESDVSSLVASFNAAVQFIALSRST